MPPTVTTTGHDGASKDVLVGGGGSGDGSAVAAMTDKSGEGGCGEEVYASNVIDEDDEEDEEDEDLQAALALSLHPEDDNDNDGDDDDDDETSSVAAVVVASPLAAAASVDGVAASPTAVAVERNNTEGNDCHVEEGGSAPYEFDVASFHSIMWNDVITTVNDKERWIYQDISTSPRTEGGEVAVAAAEAAAGRAQVSDGAKRKLSPLEMLTGSTNGDDAFVSSDSSLHSHDGGGKPESVPSGKNNASPHEVWGLTQKHGGPCGVLAAVQAEMIRLLLFGRTRRGGQLGGINGGDHEGDGTGEGNSDDHEHHRTFFYPSSFTQEGVDDNGVDGNGNTDDNVTATTASDVREALAMAIAMILARAAMAPAIAGTDVSSSPLYRVRVVLPSAAMPSSSSSSSHAAAAAVVSPEANILGGGIEETKGEKDEQSDLLRQPHSGWIWEMIDSAQSQSLAAVAASSKKPCGLVVHTLSDEISSTTDGTTEATVTAGTSSSNGDNSDEIDEKDMSFGTPESKRQKKKVSFSSGKKSNGNGDGVSAIPTATEVTSDQDRDLTDALALAVTDFLLGRGRGGSSLSEDGKERAASAAGGRTTNVVGVASEDGVPLDYFQGPGGVMFLVMSLVESRGIERIRSDMDDPNTTITSQFGHSSQELINLLLTGQAVSNVFDNTMTISGDLACRGVQRRSAVGYLSQLESLRYCEVGGHYKSPIFPIWVVGSTSHFSVLFGDELCLRESKSDLLLEKCRRAFKKVEGGGGDNGFIQSDKLGEVIDELDLRGNVGGDHGVNVMQAYLEVSGAGIILWDDFWKSCSRLMTGSTLESIMNDEGPPLMITQFGEGEASASAASASLAGEHIQQQPQSLLESDEELARKLAAEWGTDETTSAAPEAAATQGTKSDEDYARELQAQWDAEASGAGTSGGDGAIDLTSEAAVADGAETLSSMGTPTLLTVEGKADTETDNEDVSIASADINAMCTAEVTIVKTDAVDRSKQQKFDFEKHGTSFPLYHYNGLRGGCLTHFRVTRLSPEEAVGASIALSSRGGSGAQQSAGGSGGGDLEDVVRTKWPSCMFNWFGNYPPYID